MILIYLFLEGVIGPRLSIVRWLQLPAPPSWIRVPALLVLGLALIRFVARVKLSRVGLYGWHGWSGTERSYFLQAVCLGNTVFLFIFAHRLRIIAADHSVWGKAIVIVLTQLAWGIYQELMYRGVLQTALVARWGPLAGILVANTLFTLGPLHFYHFASASPFPMFAAVFAIGLFFSLLFWRSGNLWIVGVLHGLGSAYIDGLSLL